MTEEEAHEANPSFRIYIAKVLAERVYEILGIYRQLVVTQKVAPQTQFSKFSRYLVAALEICLQYQPTPKKMQK